MLVTLVLITGVSFLLFYDFGKTNSRLIDEILNYGHLPLFGVVALVILWILNKGSWPCTEKKKYITAAFITILLAILTECIQVFTPDRYLELGDILNDTIGAVTFLTFVYSLQSNLSVSLKARYMGASVLLMALPTIPIFVAALDTWNIEREFPLISSLETSIEMDRWSSKESAMSRTRLYATDGEYSLKVNLYPGIYPGISMDYLHNDWRGYGNLCFDVFLEGSTPLEITVRINDRKHNDEFTDRYNKGFRLHPGDNHISIRLGDVKNAPRGRMMDMGNITNICIFSYNLKEPRSMYFDNFRLKNWALLIRCYCPNSHDYRQSRGITQEDFKKFYNQMRVICIENHSIFQ